LAFVEKLKALVMLENYKDAKKLLAQYKDMTRSLDDAFDKEGVLYNAPSAKMYLWIAERDAALAKKETDQTKRIKLNSDALKGFYRVIKNYDIKLCPYVPVAAKGFNNTKLELEKDGKKITADVEIPANFDLDRAEELFSKEKFEQVIPIVLKILKSKGGKSSEHTPELLYKLTYSYFKTGKILEAITIAGFMADTYPDYDNTPALLLILGETKWKEYEKDKTSDAGEKALKDSISIYGWYTRNCPTHQYAPPICARIAKLDYDIAADMAQAANKMKNGPEKLNANLAAREQFKIAIPKYQYIVDNYFNTDIGKDSAFLLALCYSNSFQYVDSSKRFARFCELETNREKKEERDMGRVADAKFRLSDNYVRHAELIRKEADKLRKKAEKAPETVEGNDPKIKSKTDLLKLAAEKDAESQKYFNKAIENFKELTIKWMNPGGRLHNLKQQKNKDKVKLYYDQTIAYIPWVYDYAGDADKTIAAFSEFLEKFPDHTSVPKALKRRAFIYIDKGETAKAAKDFETLSSKFPEEAKTVQIDLARAMYKTKNYNKSIEAVQKMLDGTVADISVQNLRWIGRNLYDCGGQHPEEGAKLALKANEILLTRIASPVLTDWVTKAKVAEFEADKEKLKKNIKTITDQLLLSANDAAYWSKDYKKALKFLDTILEDEKTPYFYKAHFKRAEVYMNLEKPEKALADYGEVSNMLLGNREAKKSMEYKTQVLVGIAYIKMGDLGKALGALAGPVMTQMAKDEELAGLMKQKEVSKEEEKLQMEFIEYAVFLSACCEKKMGNKEKATALVNIYRKSFPNGKFKSKLGALPAPEQAIKYIKIVTE